ncbi:MAG TPA: GxxExxY protein [Pyrinomonadaceae bacterium]|jgi:GxxExxY protein
MEISNLTHTIIGCAYKVHNTLGSGFLEKVYENALKIELDKLNIEARQQQELQVWYEGHVVGIYHPDLWIDSQLIIEVKAVQNLLKQHELQLVHYLTATHIDNGLLINFGSSVQVKRKFREYKPKSILTGLQNLQDW